MQCTATLADTGRGMNADGGYDMVGAWPCINQTGPVSAARLITATERERPQSGHELSRAQEWCSESQLAHRYERCNLTSLLMPT